MSGERTEYRVVVKQSGGELCPAGVEPLGTCLVRAQYIRGDIEGSEIEDVWIEKRTVVEHDWERAAPSEEDR